MAGNDDLTSWFKSRLDDLDDQFRRIEKDLGRGALGRSPGQSQPTSPPPAPETKPKAPPLGRENIGGGSARAREPEPAAPPPACAA